MVDSVLREVIALLAAILGFSWMAYTIVFRRNLTVSVLFCSANFLAGAGAWLVSLRSDVPNFLYYQAADWAVMGGFTCIWIGIQENFNRQRRAEWLKLLPLGIAIGGTALLSPSPESYESRALLFNAVCTVVFLGAFLDLLKGFITQHLHRSRALFIAAPLFISGAVFAARGVYIFFKIVGSDTPLHDAQGGYATFLRVFIVTLAMINVSMVSMVVGQLISELRHAADHDPLTGLFNRGFATNFLQKEYQRYRRTGRSLACILIDVDHFKTINDTYGHVTGDKALLYICAVFAERLRTSDVFARYGGEEFIVLCPDTEYTVALDIAERLRQALESAPVDIHDQTLQLTASLGVAVLGPSDDIETLIRNVDAALYDAKHAGRNRVCHHGLQSHP